MQVFRLRWLVDILSYLQQPSTQQNDQVNPLKNSLKETCRASVSHVALLREHTTLLSASQTFEFYQSRSTFHDVIFLLGFSNDVINFNGVGKCQIYVNS